VPPTVSTLVLGAGVIGVTTAYYLACEGHLVTVVDQNAEVGQDATSGNAGLIAPGHCFAWASPGVPRMLLRSLRGEATAIRVKPRLDPLLVWWGLRFLRECTATRERMNTLALHRLCRYGQEQLAKLANDESIDYQQIQRGALYLYRDQAGLAAGIAKTRLLRDQGQRIDVLRPEELAALDPAFGAACGRLAGAIHVPSDASGNSALFTALLAERCRALGVQFNLETTALRFVRERGKVRRVDTDRGPLSADNFVLALGVNSPFLSRTAGHLLPVYPVKGYSLTVPIADERAAPTIPGTDEATRLAWSRMGGELRISSTAELAGYDRTWTKDHFHRILAAAHELFPGAARWQEARMRSCLRPVTPAGPPIVGRSKLPNLFYNTGHGHLGWTMACGSSRMLADIIVYGRASFSG
jgi:D-amino-acid dehydrogenase